MFIFTLKLVFFAGVILLLLEYRFLLLYPPLYVTKDEFYSVKTERTCAFSANHDAQCVVGRAAP